MISYEPFWKTLIKKDLNTYKFQKKFEVSGATMKKLRNDEILKTSTIDQICKFLNCDVKDIMKYVPDEQYKNTYQEVYKKNKDVL